MKYSPIGSVSFAGECIPNSFLMPPMIKPFGPKISPIFPNNQSFASFMPFQTPSIMRLPTSFTLSEIVPAFSKNPFTVCVKASLPASYKSFPKSAAFCTASSNLFFSAAGKSFTPSSTFANHAGTSFVAQSQRFLPNSLTFSHNPSMKARKSSLFLYSRANAATNAPTAVTTSPIGFAAMTVFRRPNAVFAALIHDVTVWMILNPAIAPVIRMIPSVTNCALSEIHLNAFVTPSRADFNSGFSTSSARLSKPAARPLDIDEIISGAALYKAVPISAIAAGIFAISFPAKYGITSVNKVSNAGLAVFHQPLRTRAAVPTKTPKL